jgi:hypothetical protein
MDDLVVLTSARAKLRKSIKLSCNAIESWGYKLQSNEKKFIK